MPAPDNDTSAEKTEKGTPKPDAKRENDRARNRMIREIWFGFLSLVQVLTWPLALIAAILLILHTTGPWVTKYLEIEQLKAKSTQGSGVWTLSCGKRCGCSEAMTTHPTCPACLPACLPAGPPKTGGAKRKCSVITPTAENAAVVPGKTGAPTQ